jgi:seryl-tRNA synthetase
MLDINKIIANPDLVAQKFVERNFCALEEAKKLIAQLIELDKKRRELISKIEKLQADRNQHSKTKPSTQIIEKMRVLGDQINNLNNELNDIQNNFDELLTSLPNIPADGVQPGGPEKNKVVKVFASKPVFSFTPKNHIELAKSLNLIDYERGVKIAGAGFWLYTGLGALLEWALLNYFIESHRANGYTFILPPYLLTEQSAYTSGHLPKFRDDLFWTQDKLCLNATSEMMLGNMFRDEVLQTDKLPLKFYAFSTCFRREAGGYRTEERGMVRGHQFNKVEMFQFTKPEDSDKAFDEMVATAASLVEGLGLHFQITNLASGDMSFAMARTSDIEVWIPSMGIYKEVSSASNACDYQARRGNIRYKNTQTGKNEFVHTLNASGLATSRLLPAILEQNQQADGSVIVPKVLQKYLGFELIKVE